MEASVAPLEVVVRGRTFRLNAPANERETLADAILTVQSKCDSIATLQPSADSERVLLLVALELAAQRGSSSNESGERLPAAEQSAHAARITALQEQLDLALSRAASASQA
jgi:cell division protein ZapA (FtsZ GTPase activity inhibitor)